MPKRELSKCREWERERRDRLKTCFEALGRVLPSYDPCIVLSKLEILQRATAFIDDLQRRNKEIICTGQASDKLEKDDIKALQDRITYLLSRIEQLVSLLKNAGIKVPAECGDGKEFTKPKFWSNKISKEQAEVLAEKVNSLQNKKTKKKTIKKLTSPPQKILTSAKRSTAKRVRINSENKCVKRRKLKHNKVIKVSGPTVTHVVRAGEVTRPSMQTAPTNIIHCVSSMPMAHSVYVSAGVANSVKSGTLPRTSLVVSNNTTPYKNALVTNSAVTTTPIMATGINQRNTALSSLGPGTLILANGSIVPVLPPPTPTIIQPPTILTAVVNQSTKPTVVLLSNHKSTNKLKTVSSTSSSIKKSSTKTGDTKSLLKQLPKLIPKLGITKTTTINKVPIPALTSRYTVPTQQIAKLNDKATKKIKQNNKHSESNVKTIDSTNLDSSSKISQSIAIDSSLTSIGACQNKEPVEIQTKQEIRSSEQHKTVTSNTVENLTSVTVSESASETPSLCKKANSPIEINTEILDQNKENEISQQKLPVSSYSIDSLCKINSNKCNSELKIQATDVKFKDNNTMVDEKAVSIPVTETSYNDIDDKMQLKISSDIQNCSKDKCLLPSSEKNEEKKYHNDIPSKILFTQNPLKLTDNIQQKSITCDNLLPPISYSQPELSTTDTVTKPSEALTLSLPHTDFSNDIFASLHVPSGAQHPESISPTAAFLLAFPLVSTLTGGKAAEVVDDENSDSQHDTPTLLQIGNIESSKQPSDNLLSLDNLQNFFTPKDFANMDISKITKSPTKKVTDIKMSTENKCLDYENNNDNSAMLYKNKQMNKLLEKDKLTFDSCSQINSNCIFADIPLFQNISSGASNIFSYEHTPVTYSASKSSDIYPITDSTSHSNDIANKTSISFQQKRTKVSHNHQLSSHVPIPYTQTESLFQPLNTTTYGSQRLPAYSHFNVKLDTNLNTPISIQGSKNSNYESSDNYNNCNLNMPTNTYEFGYGSIKSGNDKSSISVPYSVHSSGNSISENLNVENPGKPDQTNLSKTYHLSTKDNSGTKLGENSKVSEKLTHNLPCQNAFNSDQNRDHFKYPGPHLRKEKQLQGIYHQQNTPTNISYKADYNLNKNNNKSIVAQKPLVNWMTSPDVRPTNDFLLPAYGKDNDSSQSTLFGNNILPSTSQTFYSTTNSYYQNLDSINNGHDSPRKHNALEQPFHVIPPPNYSKSGTYNQSEENQFSWSPTKLPPPLLDHSQHLLVPSTLPTLIGDLALNTNVGQSKAEQKIDYDIDYVHKKIVDDSKNYGPKDNANKSKGKQLYTDQPNPNNFLSVSQLVEHNKPDQNHSRSHSNLLRKATTTTRQSKTSATPRPLKRTSKIHEESMSKNQNNVLMDTYGNLKNIPDIEHKHGIGTTKSVNNISTFSMQNLDNYSIPSTIKEPDWLRSDTSTNKSNYKNCSSNYSAEALIGANSVQNVTQLSSKSNRYSSQNYAIPHKRNQISSQFGTDAIGPPFYSTIDLTPTQDNNYYSQASNNSFSTYTSASTVYQHTNFMTSAASSVGNYIPPTGLLSDLEAEYNSHTSGNNNLNTNLNNLKQTYSKSTTHLKSENRLTNAPLSDKKNSGNTCPTTQTKRNNVKRKQFLQDSNNLPGLADLGFLSMPAINSPLLSDDPFHSHPNFFPSTAPQLYQNSSQNSLYPKSLNQTNHDLSTPCNLLPPLPAAPITRGNIPPATQVPAPSPNIGSGGTSLTNFNLSTIFPEINKQGAMTLHGVYNDSSLRSSASISNMLPPHSAPQIAVNSKTSYFSGTGFDHKGPLPQFSSS